MSRFNVLSKNEIPEVSTASLPDIVFMLLFFFMTVTVMKDNVLKVENELPHASEIKKIERRDRVIYIHVGRPSKNYETVFGTEPKIQLNDKYADINDIGPYVLEQIGDMPENLQGFAMVSLKVDRKTNMGLISDIKRELRKVGALKIRYTTYDGSAFSNFE